MWGRTSLGRIPYHAADSGQSYQREKITLIHFIISRSFVIEDKDINLRDAV